MDSPGTVFWITGISGAGKTTVARHCHALLRSLHANVVLLDGDAVRQVMGDDLGHDLEHRLRNAYRMSRLCHMLSQQGLHVLAATMSLFHECQAWNRENIPRYFEVYLKVSVEVARSRDPKGLYQRFDRGEAQDVVGLDLPVEEPLLADLVLPNSQELSDASRVAREILATAASRGFIAWSDSQLKTH